MRTTLYCWAKTQFSYRRYSIVWSCRYAWGGFYVFQVQMLQQDWIGSEMNLFLAGKEWDKLNWFICFFSHLVVVRRVDCLLAHRNLDRYLSVWIICDVEVSTDCRSKVVNSCIIAVGTAIQLVYISILGSVWKCLLFEAFFWIKIAVVKLERQGYRAHTLGLALNSNRLFLCCAYLIRYGYARSIRVQVGVHDVKGGAQTTGSSYWKDENINWNGYVLQSVACAWYPPLFTQFMLIIIGSLIYYCFSSPFRTGPCC